MKKIACNGLVWKSIGNAQTFHNAFSAALFVMGSDNVKMKPMKQLVPPGFVLQVTGNADKATNAFMNTLCVMVETPVLMVLTKKTVRIGSV